ncbi:unnamed protein product [Leuciscus chuanchicus]
MHPLSFFCWMIRLLYFLCLSFLGSLTEPDSCPLRLSCSLLTLEMLKGSPLRALLNRQDEKKALWNLCSLQPLVAPWGSWDPIICLSSLSVRRVYVCLDSTMPFLDAVFELIKTTYRLLLRAISFFSLCMFGGADHLAARVFRQSLLTLNPGHMVLIDRTTTLWRMLFGGP